MVSCAASQVVIRCSSDGGAEMREAPESLISLGPRGFSSGASNGDWLHETHTVALTCVSPIAVPSQRFGLAPAIIASHLYSSTDSVAVRAP